MGKTKVYFYKMDIFTQVYLKNDLKLDTVRKIYYPERVLFKEFDNIYKTKTINNSIALEKGNNQVTLEFIYFEKDFMFARMGRISDANRVHIRNKIDFSYKEIERDKDEGIEIYTYFLLNFNTGIISFITGLGTPQITKLNNLIKLGSKKYDTEIVPIINSDVIEIVKNKPIISKFQVKIALPSDEILDMEHLGLSLRDFINIKDLKYQTIDITIKAEREKNVFNLSRMIEDVINKIKSLKIGQIKTLMAEAKDLNGEIESYNFLEEKFIQQIKINEEQREEGPKTIFKALKDIYEKHEATLKKFCRISNERDGGLASL
jgi:hypothetical protein